MLSIRQTASPWARPGRAMLFVAVLLMMTAVRKPEARSIEAEGEAKKALEAFITAWNTGEDSNLRKTMHFPFISLFSARTTQIANQPEEFSAGFDRMREREKWLRSAFDFDSFAVIISSPDKVHCEIDFERYNTAGERYTRGRVMYIVTKRDGRWAIQMRTAGTRPDALNDTEREKVVDGARRALSKREPWEQRCPPAQEGLPPAAARRRPIPAQTSPERA